MAILLRELCHYNVMILRNKFLKLGGHGYVNVRFNRNALSKLTEMGYAVDKGLYYTASDLGRKLVENHGEI